MPATHSNQSLASRARDQERPTRWDLLPLALILLLGIALRLYRLNAENVWTDEANTIANSALPLPGLFADLLHDSYHPPLHFLLLKGWFAVAGFGVVQARLISVFFGSLSIPLLYLLARRFTDSRTSAVASLLLAVSQMAVYFSREARSYSQVHFLSLVVALAFFQFVQQPGIRQLLCLVAASAALLYTHYYGLAILIALGLYWLPVSSGPDRLVVRRMFLGAGLLLLAYTPWLIALRSNRSFPQALPSTKRMPASVRPNVWSPIAALNRLNNGKFESIDGETAPFSLLLGVVLFTGPVLGGLRHARKPDSRGLTLGVLLAAVPVGLAIAVSALGPVFSYRHYSMATPGYCLAVAVGWNLCFPHKRTRHVWLAAMVAYSLLALRANYAETRPDYRAGFLPLAKHYRTNDCVSGPHLYTNTRLHLAWETYYPQQKVGPLFSLAALPAAQENCERLWIVWDRAWWRNQDREAVSRNRQAIDQLNGRFVRVEFLETPAIELQLWKRR